MKYIVELQFEIENESVFMVRKIFEVAVEAAKETGFGEMIKTMKVNKVYWLPNPANKENAKEEIS